VAFEGDLRFVGLGFGAIQAGLFVYEAHETGRYAPPLVVDVRPDLVSALRRSGGWFRVNIARTDRIDIADIGPVAIADSSLPDERPGVVRAIASADEAATALPSVDFYRTPLSNSPHLLLAEGLTRRRRSGPLVVYCAENHRRAAAMLEEAVLDAVEPGNRDRLRRRARFVDTVIGKMSGVVSDSAELRSLGLATVTPHLSAAFLVEEFNHILVSRIDPPSAEDAIQPGMPVLSEVDDLAPFEAAKLLGHNATHALAGFLGKHLGLRLVAELPSVPGAMGFLRAAFIEESGQTLCRRFAGADPLFTRAGYAAFADDVLVRMINPFLADTIDRAGRDQSRKLGWDDRLVGLLRMGLAENVPTPRYAMGVAAGLRLLQPGSGVSGSSVERLLRDCWPPDVDPDEAGAVLRVLKKGHAAFRHWQAYGFPGSDAAW